MDGWVRGGRWMDGWMVNDKWIMDDSGCLNKWVGGVNTARLNGWMAVWLNIYRWIGWVDG